MKIGILAWDYTGVDPDGPNLAEFGRERGHETSLFTLKEIDYLPGDHGPDLLLKGEPASSFDAVISRARLHGDDWQDRVERLSMLSHALGERLFDSADVWHHTYSKFLMNQKLAQAGFPVPPVRSATSLEEVAAACDQWGSVILKPSYGYGGRDVERITDVEADRAVAEGLLDTYETLMCQPYYPTQYGEYRITVAGDVAPMNILKLPPVGSWRCKTLEGASFERLDAPEDLIDLSFRATRHMGLTLSGLDVLPDPAGGWVIIEVNMVPGWLHMLGREQHRATLGGVYDWVEKKVAAL